MPPGARCCADGEARWIAERLVAGFPRNHDEAPVAASVLRRCLPAAPPMPRRPCIAQGQRAISAWWMSASGTLAIVDTSERRVLAEVPVWATSRMPRWCSRATAAPAFVFGRDGALTLRQPAHATHRAARDAGRQLDRRRGLAGTASLVAAQNYQPGGVKVFDAKTLALVADIPAEYAPGKPRAWSPLADLPGQRSCCAVRRRPDLVADRRPRRRRLTKFENIGRQPYDALVTPDGTPLHRRPVRRRRFGADRPVVGREGRCAASCRLRPRPGTAAGLQDAAPARLAVAGRHAYLPAIGRHEVLVVDTESWAEVGASPSPASRCSRWRAPTGARCGSTSPCLTRPVQVIDTRHAPGGEDAGAGQGGAAHGIHAARRSGVDQSRDANRVSCIRHAASATLATLPLDAPSGGVLHQPRRAHGFWMPRLDLLNRWQHGFPLTPAVHARVGAAPGVDEAR